MKTSITAVLCCGEGSGIFYWICIKFFLCCLEVPMHYRSLERDKISRLVTVFDFQKSIQLSEASKAELNWWLNNLTAINGKLIRPNAFEFYCRTDASLMGFSCVDLNSGKATHGRWSSEQHQISYFVQIPIFSFSVILLLCYSCNIPSFKTWVVWLLWN